MNATLTAPAHNFLFSSSAMGLGEQKAAFSYFERDGRRVMQVKDTAVFRSGTFRNSWGEQFTWGDEELRLFVQNFDHLRSQGILPDVPVRKGHPVFGQNNMDALIGYVTSLRTVKKSIASGEYTFLVADYEILDPDAQEKIASGLWKNRSAEVGRYVDNNDVEYAPTFLGFAYVDIPAVEGLNQYGKAADGFPISIITEEVMAQNDGSTAAAPVPAPPAPVPAGEHSAPASQQAPMMFSINGERTSDYGRVQEYINGLESQVAEFARAEAERAEAERVEFVNALAAEGKILATMLDSTLAFAKGLSAEQFSAWKGMFEGAAAPSLLQPHGEQDHEEGRIDPPAPADAQFSKDRDIVNRLALSGYPIDKIKEMAAYKNVIARDPSFTIAAPASYGQ